MILKDERTQTTKHSASHSLEAIAQFVHVERVAFALEVALLVRQFVELVVDQRQQLLDGLAVAVAVVVQQLGNLYRWIVRHEARLFLDPA